MTEPSCVCPNPYTDVTRNCSSFFDVIPSEAQYGFLVPAFIVWSAIVLFFVNDIAMTLRIKGWRYFIRFVGAAILVAFLAILLKYISLVLLAIDTSTGVPTHMAIATLIHLIHVNVLFISYLVTSTEWMSLLIKAKRLEHRSGLKFLPLPIKICIGILHFCTFVVLPFSIVGSILAYLNIEPHVLGPVPQYLAIICVFIPIVITSFYIIRVLIYFSRIKNSSVARRTIRRTVWLILVHITMLLHGGYQFVNINLLFGKSEVTFALLVESTIAEAFIVTFLFMFLATYATSSPLAWARYWVRNEEPKSSDSSNTPERKSTGRNRRSSKAASTATPNVSGTTPSTGVYSSSSSSTDSVSMTMVEPRGESTD